MESNNRYKAKNGKNNKKQENEENMNITALPSLKFVYTASSKLLISVIKAVMDYPKDELAIKEVANLFETTEENVKAIISTLSKKGIDGVEECMSKLYSNKRE